MSQKSKPMTRRNFLKVLGVPTTLPLLQNPLQILIESILLTAGSEVKASSDTSTPRRLLQIFQEGAPSKWTFDLFLKPYGGDFKMNPNMVTHFMNTQGAFENVRSPQGLEVPWLWQFPILSQSGEAKPLYDLLDNLISLRGLSINNSDHSACQAMQNLPLGASQSISALPADLSIFPMAAVNASIREYRFRSLKNKTAVTVGNSGNLLKNLLGPFVRNSSVDMTFEKADFKNSFNASLKLLNNIGESFHPENKKISGVVQSSKNLLAQGFGDLEQQWNELVTKYNIIIQKNLVHTLSLRGIGDTSILADGSKLFQLDKQIIPKDFDLRTMIQSTTNIQRMAAHFAMAEFIFKNDLSSSVSISPGPLSGLSIGDNKNLGCGFDEHETSLRVSAFLNTFYNRSLGACLVEFIEQLKTQKKWEETVIVMGGEFSRNPKNDGTGSDHGNTGAHSTFLSGSIRSPLVLGNIYATDPNKYSPYSATWGQGSNVKELGRPLNLGDWASTLSFLLRAKSPLTSTQSLLIEKGGSFVSTIEKARQT